MRIRRGTMPSGDDRTVKKLAARFDFYLEL